MAEREERPRGRSGWLWVALAAAALAGGFGAARWWLGRKPAPEAAAPPAAPAAAPAPAPGAPAAPMDPARVRSLLEGLSASPLYRGALAQPDLLRRWAQVTENLAEGVVPRGPLAFLARTRPFAVVERGGKAWISPEAYRRYDDVAEAVASVDAQAFARVYREVHPALDAAFRALGYPEGALDRATAKALRRIEGVPVPDGEVAVVPVGAVWAYADPKLEGLSPVDRQLLRMGPRNARLVQAKARELSQALALEPATAGSTAPSGVREPPASAPPTGR